MAPSFGQRVVVRESGQAYDRQADPMTRDSTHKSSWSYIPETLERIEHDGPRETTARPGVRAPAIPRPRALASFSAYSLGGEAGEYRSPLPIRRKLNIGADDDPVENEADRVAAQVAQGPFASPGTPSFASGRGGIHPLPPVIAGSSVVSSTLTTAPPIVHDVLAQPGTPLDITTRNVLEPRFGHDFSQVRIHTDPDAALSATAIHARAFAVGHHVVFNAGYFSPHTDSGKSLLVHELTHVVQQSDHAKTLQRSPVATNPWRSDVRAARYRGRLMAKRISTHGLLSRDARDKINRELATFEGPAKDAYIHEIKPALQQVFPIEMPADYQTPRKPKPVELLGRVDDPQLCGGKCFTDRDIETLLSESAPKVETDQEAQEREAQIQSLRGRTNEWGPYQDFAIDLLRRALQPDRFRNPEAVAFFVRAPILNHYKAWLQLIDDQRMKRYRSGALSNFEIIRGRGNGDDPTISWFADESRHGPSAIASLRRELAIAGDAGGTPADQVFYAVQLYRRCTDPHEIEMAGLAASMVDVFVGLATGIGEHPSGGAFPAPEEAVRPVGTAPEPQTPTTKFGLDAPVLQGGGLGDQVPRGNLHDADLPAPPSPPPGPSTPISAAPEVDFSRPAQNENQVQQTQPQKIAVGGGTHPTAPPSNVRRTVPSPQPKPRMGSVSSRPGAPINDDVLQQKTVKPATPPEDTHSVRPTAPGTNPEPHSTQVGNFAEKYFNKLPKMLADQGIPTTRAISGRIPPGAGKYKIRGWKGTAPGGRPLEIDALDREGGAIIEIKPDTRYDQGLAEAQGYADIMDKVDPLPPQRLADGTLVPRRWKPVCLTYDGEAVGKLHDHYFPPRPETPPTVTP
jgi:hypothetical protein